jgi:hypothetical protein
MYVAFQGINSPGCCTAKNGGTEIQSFALYRKYYLRLFQIL